MQICLRVLCEWGLICMHLLRGALRPVWTGPKTIPERNAEFKSEFLPPNLHPCSKGIVVLIWNLSAKNDHEATFCITVAVPWMSMKALSCAFSSCPCPDWIATKGRKCWHSRISGALWTSVQILSKMKINLNLICFQWMNSSKFTEVSALELDGGGFTSIFLGSTNHKHSPS